MFITIFKTSLQWLPVLNVSFVCVFVVVGLTQKPSMSLICTYETDAAAGCYIYFLKWANSVTGFHIEFSYLFHFGWFFLPSPAVWLYSWGDMTKCLLNPDRKPIRQSKAITKDQFGKPMTFIGVAYRNMTEGLLTGTEMSQSSLITKAYSSMGDCSQKLGTCTILHKLQNLFVQ